MQHSHFSFKGFLVGTACCIAVGMLVPWGLMLQYIYWGFNPSSPAAIFTFVVITLFLNVLLKTLDIRLQLAPADLVMIYCMLLIAVTVPTWGLMFFLLGTMVYPFYYATPENRFAELFHDLIPRWMAPQDPTAIKHYYEGLPRGASIPWGAWLEPLAFWFALILAIGFMQICVSAILHRQWSVHERLSYPMVQLPQSMIEKGEDPLDRIAPFFRNPLVWIGAALPFICFSLTALHHYYEIFPEFKFFWDRIWWFRRTVWLVFAFSFAWVGFFYLASLEVSFSVWFFYVLCKLEEGAFKTIGIASTEKLSAYEYSQSADLTHQASGAVIVFILFGLWTARVHLRQVLRKAWRPASGVDDGGELLSYRAAVIGLAVSLVFISVWLWRSGVPVFAVPVLVAVSLVFFILVARVVATAGVATARSPIVPAYFIISAIGAPVIGSKGLVALNFTFIWQGESRTNQMVACANGLKLAEMIPGSKRPLFWAMLTALVCSLVGSAYMTLSMTYEHGAINLNLINWAGGHGWPYVGPTMDEMPEANARGWLFKGIGGGLQGFLMWAQHRWFWWPLHPLGFAIAVGWLTGHIWFSALVAWTLKLSILHFGGGGMFRRMKPFFLGLIMGEAAVAGFWGIVFAFTAERGRLLTNF